MHISQDLANVCIGRLIPRAITIAVQDRCWNRFVGFSRISRRESFLRLSGCVYRWVGFVRRSPHVLLITPEPARFARIEYTRTRMDVEEIQGYSFAPLTRTLFVIVVTRDPILILTTILSVVQGTETPRESWISFAFRNPVDRFPMKTRKN